LLKLDEEITFRAIGIKSANDEPIRDPSSIELYFIDEEDEEIPICKISKIKFKKRWETKIWKIPKRQKGKNFRINFFNDKTTDIF
jgi:hypothetical protein